jgi:Tfp pilus assembly protein PilX
MFRNVPSVQRTPMSLWAGRVHRRGTALILVLLMTVTLAAIAMSAILLTGSGGMIGRYYDRERDFRYAAEASLQMGKARLLRDTTIHLPDTGYVTLVSGGQITGADGLVIPNVKVNLYAGYTNITTGQFGQYASVVAEAYDAGGTRYVRRLEMQAENFARYAMFTNTFSGGLCYSTGEFIAGRAHSNQGWYSCNSPTYYDTVSAVLSVTGGSPTYKKGTINGAPYIPIPPVGKLASLHTHAVEGNLDVVANGNDSGSVRTRIEFVPVDLDNDGKITGANEGFLRVYQAVGPAGTAGHMKSDSTFQSSGVAYEDSLCGDWHVDNTGRSRFYTIAAHNTQWFRNNFLGGAFPKLVPVDALPVTLPIPTNMTDAGRDVIMKMSGGGSNFRCYMGGDPHLVSTERRLMLPALNNGAADRAKWQKGGEDTTITDSTEYGYWQKWSGAVAPVQAIFNLIPAGSPYFEYSNHAASMWPLHRSLNPNVKGVIHVHGPVILSGVLRGSVTIYAAAAGAQQGFVGFGDDLVYAQDPASATCANLLGIISDGDQLILDNAINSPQKAGTGGGWTYRWADGDDNGMSTSHDFVLHGVTMSRTGTVGVQNFQQHPENVQNCNAANSGRGCIRQAGGVIEQVITATYSNKGDGYGENRSVDVCLNTQSPPYFPTTGRFIDNRFYEIDPARYNITTLFQSMQGGY